MKHLSEGKVGRVMAVSGRPLSALTWARLHATERRIYSVYIVVWNRGQGWILKHVLASTRQQYIAGQARHYQMDDLLYLVFSSAEFTCVPTHSEDKCYTIGTHIAVMPGMRSIAFSPAALILD